MRLYDVFVDCTILVSYKRYPGCCCVCRWHVTNKGSLWQKSFRKDLSFFQVCGGNLTKTFCIANLWVLRTIFIFQMWQNKHANEDCKKERTANRLWISSTKRQLQGPKAKANGVELTLFFRFYFAFGHWHDFDKRKSKNATKKSQLIHFLEIIYKEKEWRDFATFCHSGSV